MSIGKNRNRNQLAEESITTRGVHCMYVQGAAKPKLFKNGSTTEQKTKGENR
jgi:hypothetical protein